MVHPLKTIPKQGEGRTSSLVLESNLWTERLPVVSIMERQRLGGPSWDHTSKAIQKKKKISVTK